MGHDKKLRNDDDGTAEHTSAPAQKLLVLAYGDGGMVEIRRSLPLSFLDRVQTPQQRR